MTFLSAGMSTKSKNNKLSRNTPPFSAQHWNTFVMTFDFFLKEEKKKIWSHQVLRRTRRRIRFLFFFVWLFRCLVRGQLAAGTFLSLKQQFFVHLPVEVEDHENISHWVVASLEKAQRYLLENKSEISYRVNGEGSCVRLNLPLSSPCFVGAGSNVLN